MLYILLRHAFLANYEMANNFKLVPSILPAAKKFKLSCYGGNLQNWFICFSTLFLWERLILGLSLNVLILVGNLAWKVIFDSISINLCGRDQHNYYLGLLDNIDWLFSCIILSVFILFILKIYGCNKNVHNWLSAWVMFLVCSLILVNLTINILI